MSVNSLSPVGLPGGDRPPILIAGSNILDPVGAALAPYLDLHPSLVGLSQAVIIASMINELADAYEEIGTLQTAVAHFSNPK